MPTQKTILVSRSQGERGATGHRKKYIIYAGGDNRVVVRWGRAELDESWYQRKVVEFDSEAYALIWATDQMYKKMDKGYELIERIDV